jgi:hypothetical protein
MKAKTKKKLSAPVKKWLQALRSGKFKQTTGQLADEVGHCCLGVACEVAIKEGVIKKYNHQNGMLPEKVRKFFGLSTGDGFFHKPVTGKSGIEFNALTELNDEGKKSFKQIAQFIERQPEGLFAEKA